MTKKLNFGLKFGQFNPNLGPKFFFIVASYHCMQLQGKLIKQTWENGKKPSFEPPKIFVMDFTSTTH